MESSNNTSNNNKTIKLIDLMTNRNIETYQYSNKLNDLDEDRKDKLSYCY